MKSFIKKLIPSWVLNLYHATWPLLGAILYRFPSSRIKVIGITGTNGKTTVVHLTTHLLESAGFKVASISSLMFKIGNKEWKNKLKMTMPGRLKMQKFLRQAVNAGCEYAVMEVTSEGIKQNRHRYISFNTAVLTNLTPEHIESHGGFDNYKSTKGKFFGLPHEVSIVNADDETAEYFLNFNADKKIVYSINEDYENDDLEVVIAQNISENSNGIEFEIDSQKFTLRLLGIFNVYNALCAVSIGLAENIKLKTISDSLKTANTIPGRLEKVIGEPFSVFVDYAHTPDALEKVLKTVSNLKAKKILLVMGAAGGGRDKWKRPEFAKIAEKYADYTIITNEDPYDENPASILEEIEAGFSQIRNSPDSKAIEDPRQSRDKLEIQNKFKTQNTKYEKILDRRKAINKILQAAKEGDIVVIAGKGAEPLMMTKEGPINWDDRDIVREEFTKLYF